MFFCYILFIGLSIRKVSGMKFILFLCRLGIHLSQYSVSNLAGSVMWCNYCNAPVDPALAKSLEEKNKLLIEVMNLKK